MNNIFMTKNILAKLICGEDINIVHTNVSTPMIDLRQRVMYFPFWKNITSEMYDLFIGHESGHARYTPYEHFHKESHPKGTLFKAYLNIVDDARIEKLICRRFNGLKKSFAIAYTQLHEERDFFGLKESDKLISERSLIDRINLYFKIGNIVYVKFNPEEQVYVDRIAEIETFQQVEEICLELYEKELERLRKEKKNEEKEKDEKNKDSKEQKTKSSEDGQQSLEQPDVQTYEDEQSEEEKEDYKKSGPAKDEDVEEQESEKEAPQPSNESEASEEKADNPEKEDEEPETKEDSANSSSKVEDKEDKTEKSDDSIFEGDIGRPDSYDHSEKVMKKINTDSDIIDGHHHYEMPSALNLDLSRYLVSAREVLARFNRIFCRNEIHNHRQSQIMNNKDNFLQAHKVRIMNYVNEFNRKKHGSIQKRVMTNKTGTIDPNKLVNYKFTDDIFSSFDSVKDEKNHYFMIFIDFSGSMGSIINQVIKNVIMQVAFLRIINVPYQVMAFTTGNLVDNVSINYYPNPGLCFYELFNSKQGKTETEMLMAYLLEWSKLNNSEFGYSHFDSKTHPYEHQVSKIITLGATPLLEAQIYTYQYIEEIKKRNNVDIVNAIFFTDGASTTTEFFSKSHFLEDSNKPFTNKIYTIRDMKNQQYINIVGKKRSAVPYYVIDDKTFNSYANALSYAVMRLFKYRFPDCNTCNFYYATTAFKDDKVPNHYLRTTYGSEDFTSRVKKPNFYSVANTAYDYEYIIGTLDIPQNLAQVNGKELVFNSGINPIEKEIISEFTSLVA